MTSPLGGARSIQLSYRGNRSSETRAVRMILLMSLADVADGSLEYFCHADAKSEPTSLSRKS